MPIRAAAASLLLFASGAAARAAEPPELKLATWNLEWLMTPETLRALTPACIPAGAERAGARRAVPCDVAHDLNRSRQDLAALRRHARKLDADVISLQEVDGAQAARLVFTDHEFCFSGRVAVQNNGFAIRRGLPFSCGPDVSGLSLEDDVRRGVELRLFPGTPRELRLLSVHLKSGCARDPLNADRRNCEALSRQVGALEQWIDQQAGERRSFALLGDFNRDLGREPPGPSLWNEIDDADPPDSDLVNTAEGKEFQNCKQSQTFGGYIDYIILGRRMARGLIPDSFGRALYRPRDAVRRKLSDHCPVFIRIRVADATDGAS